MNDVHYRRQAAEAQRWADRVTNDLDKAAWLHVAQGWLALIREPKPTERQAFGAEAEARGTREDSSDKSNYNHGGRGSDPLGPANKLARSGARR